VLFGLFLLVATAPSAVAWGGQERAPEPPPGSAQEAPDSPENGAGDGGTADTRGDAGGADTGAANTGEEGDEAGDAGASDVQASGRYAEARRELVRSGVAGRGVTDEAVLEAMRSVPRHAFVPDKHRDAAYENRPLPIGEGQTISQPYVVGYMTEKLRLEPDDRVLEIGTGSGYQAAVLAEIVDEVYTIEILDSLSSTATHRLQAQGYDNVTVKNADGYYGWKEHAPFDAVIVTAAAGHIPPPLTEQLAVGGRMVIPLGGAYETQSLVLVTKEGPDDIRTEHLLPVRFVPMTGAVRDGAE
jgi:protein-L-isoaspartate(D-aspartate) O-methyltransferase